MTTKLYTAAEARRIDKERGGEGYIYYPSGGQLYYFDSEKLCWRMKEGNWTVIGLNVEEVCWLPVTPEPEPIVLDYLVLVDANERIKQLEKELKLLQEANDEAHDLLASREKELAEATQNYHEILADQGKLAQKFDELTEKARRKSCKDEKPSTCHDTVFFDEDDTQIGRGYYGGPEGWIGYYGKQGFFVKLLDSQVETWTWKYEADL